MLTIALLISATIPMAPESVSSGVVFPTVFPFPMSGANAPSDLRRRRRMYMRKGLSTVCFCGQGVCRIGEAWRMRACGREGWGWGANGGKEA